MGGVILPVQTFSNEENKQAAFSIVDSQGLDSEGSFNIRFRHYESPEEMYDILVEETRNGETRQLKKSGSPHQFLTLFSGHQTVNSEFTDNTSSSKPQSQPELTPTPIQNEPLRYEAEELTLNGYKVETVKNSSASGGKHISLKGISNRKGSATGIFEGETGTYQVKVGYYDENDGQSKTKVTVGGKTTSFVFDKDLPSGWAQPSAKTSRIVIEEVQLESSHLVWK